MAFSALPLFIHRWSGLSRVLSYQFPSYCSFALAYHRCYAENCNNKESVRCPEIAAE